MIYLDHNSTTRPSEGVVAAMREALDTFWFNPSSVHRPGQMVSARVDSARLRAARLIEARPREITFTSGGTESIALAVRGVLGRPGAGERVLVTSAVEHAAVRDLADDLRTSGVEVRLLPLGKDGVVDAARAREVITRGVSLVSLQWANNETGAVQPVREVAAIARDVGALVHVDATQWVGKEPASVGGAAGGWCDLLTFSPHKFHGPKGVGVLWARTGVGLKPLIQGSQELGRRGGTENVPGIFGAGAACAEAAAWLTDADARARQSALRDRLETAVLARAPGSVVNGPRGAGRRLWNTTNIGFPGLEAEALLMLLTERGLSVSAGAACSSGSLEPSPVLMAMGVPPEVAHGSVRFSLGRDTTPAEIDEAVEIVVACVERVRGLS